MATVEELLRVRDVTPDLLFGRDVNRNGQIDAAEIAREQTNEFAKSELMTEEEQAGSLDRGWSAYLTLYSRGGIGIQADNHASISTTQIYNNYKIN